MPAKASQSSPFTWLGESHVHAEGPPVDLVREPSPCAQLADRRSSWFSVPPLGGRHFAACCYFATL